MEILGVVDLPVWLLCVLALVSTVVLYTWRKRSIFKRHGFKAKPSLFLLGDLPQLGRKGFSIYDVPTVKKYGKVFGTFFGNKALLVITDTDMIKQIMVKEFSNFTERGMQTRVASSVEKFHSNLVDRIKANPEGFDMRPIYQAYTLDVICSTGFGMDIDSIRDPDNAFVRNAKTFFSVPFTANPLVSLNFFFPDLPGLEYLKIDIVPPASFEFFRGATQMLFDERKKADSDFPDLLHTMINSHKERGEANLDKETRDSIEDIKREGLSDEEVITNSMLLMLASFETTWSTLAWLTYALATHTDCQDKLIQEIDEKIGEQVPSYDNVHELRYLDMFVTEGTRYYPVAQSTVRKAKEEIDICGVTIPKGMSILFPAWALHFMPEYWEDPDEFNPERFAPEKKGSWDEYAFMPFGIGPRNCIGMRLALMEVKMTIVSILQKYRILKTDKLEVPMPANCKALNKPDKPVFVKLEARK